MTHKKKRPQEAINSLRERPMLYKLYTRVYITPENV